MAVSRNNSLLSMHMAGAQGLADALRELGEARDVRKVLKTALMEESRPIVKEARRLAPRGESGMTAEKIDVSTTLSRRQSRGARPRNRADGSEVEVYIGAGARGPAVLIEFGTAPRYHKNGKFVGATPARPFLRPAWEGGKNRLLDRIALRIWYEIDRMAALIRKRQIRKMEREARERGRVR